MHTQNVIPHPVWMLTFKAGIWHWHLPGPMAVWVAWISMLDIVTFSRTLTLAPVLCIRPNPLSLTPSLHPVQEKETWRPHGRNRGTEGGHTPGGGPWRRRAVLLLSSPQQSFVHPRCPTTLSVVVDVASISDPSPAGPLLPIRHGPHPSGHPLQCLSQNMPLCLRTSQMRRLLLPIASLSPRCVFHCIPSNGACYLLLHPTAASPRPSLHILSCCPINS